ncbi:hypothetical protein ACFSBX_17350 [Halobellus rarus]|uniref:M28 family peptidase n=1 Tax=Halobellus rarus TaxID=1126237 RepID=A0ABD6CR85_9EURY
MIDRPKDIDEGTADFKTTVDPEKLPDANHLQRWLRKKGQFNKGFMPTGSPAQAKYTKLLANDLREIGVEEVKRNGITIDRWKPLTYSLVLNSDGNEGPIPVMGYVPYSGSTSEKGIEAPVSYLSGTSFNTAGYDPKGVPGGLGGELEDRFLLEGEPFHESIKKKDVEGSIVVAELPILNKYPLNKIQDDFHLLHGDAPECWGGDHFACVAGLKILQEVQKAGAVGFVGILPYGPDMAEKHYMPYGTPSLWGLPGLYIDPFTGNQIKKETSKKTTNVSARLRLQASVEKSEAHNIHGVIPGATDREIILSSHTDGLNTLEDNGPIAILALAKYFLSIPREQRPVTLRLVLSNGHFYNNIGKNHFIKHNWSDIADSVIAAIEVEHLGALERTERTNGTYCLTGKPEFQLVSTSDAQPLVRASKKYGQQFDRIAVSPLETCNTGSGEPWIDVTDVVQLISVPTYLLNYELPDEVVTDNFHDINLFRRQLQGIVEMVLDIGNDEASDG